MNKLIVFLFLILSNTLLATPLLAELTLVDGSVFEGYADITKKDEIEFRFELEMEPETMNEFEVERLRFLEFPYGSYQYVYIKKRTKLLKLIAEGSLNVYAQYPESFSTQKSDRQKKREDYINHEKKKLRNGIFMYPGGGFNMRQHRYYIQNTTTGTIDDIKLNFKKEARKWFKDCPEIIEYTDSREWQYEDLKAIVEFYNEFCGKE